jgi:hypothetical protein
MAISKSHNSGLNRMAADSWALNLLKSFDMSLSFLWASFFIQICHFQSFFSAAGEEERYAKKQKAGLQIHRGRHNVI